MSNQNNMPMSDDMAETVERVIRALAAGEVVAVPTDTVYGLAVDPNSAIAVERLHELKRRPDQVPVAVLVASMDQAAQLVEVTPLFERLARAHWPGKLTIVATKRPDLSLHVGSDRTLGIRMPDNALIHTLAERFGPIAATSANRHGEATLLAAQAVRDHFGDDIQLVVDGGVLSEVASTVVDVTGPTVNVLRTGDVEVDLDS